MMTKSRFKACCTTKNPSKSSSGAAPQGTTGTHRINFVYAGGASVLSRADSAAEFIARTIGASVEHVRMILSAAPVDDREDLIRRAEALRRSREKSQ